MQIVRTTLAVAVATIAACGCWTQTVEAADKAKGAGAASLVDETLRREAAEGIDDRAELLKPALVGSRPSPSVYWHSGFLYDPTRRLWLLPEEIQQRAAKDRRLTAYRAFRSTRAASERGRAELARWCEKQNLPDQARAHWTEVLDRAPDDPEARRQLGFVSVNGTWLSQQDVADAQANLAQVDAALARWTPKLENLLAWLQKSNSPARDRALQELAAIKDPDAVPAIESLFCATGGETALLGIELLENMKAAEAASALAWQAVFSPWPLVRSEAAAALRSQRKHDYVPVLLAAMRSPIQARYGLYTSPDGGFLVRRAIYQEGPEGSQLAVLDVARPAVLLPSNKTVMTPMSRQESRELIRRAQIEDQRRQWLNLAIARARAMEQIRQQQAAIAAENLTTASLNTRLGSVLAEATGNAQPASPDEWYSWWYNYNELTSPGQQPTRVTYQAANQPVVAVSQVPTIRYAVSCLVAGTPVWTELGPVPVEQIRVGDRVLACD
ncbi:MAG: hypothetical protein GX621_15300, partial [Pirellulaceae bacterium]|nr:hypothetical protein [Pirellulaceae bacterium]